MLGAKERTQMGGWGGGMLEMNIFDPQVVCLPHRLHFMEEDCEGLIGRIWLTISQESGNKEKEFPEMFSPHVIQCGPVTKQEWMFL